MIVLKNTSSKTTYQQVSVLLVSHAKHLTCTTIPCPLPQHLQSFLPPTHIALPTHPAQAAPAASNGALRTADHSLTAALLPHRGPCSHTSSSTGSWNEFDLTISNDGARAFTCTHSTEKREYAHQQLFRVALHCGKADRHCVRVRESSWSCSHIRRFVAILQLAARDAQACDLQSRRARLLPPPRTPARPPSPPPRLRCRLGALALMILMNVPTLRRAITRRKAFACRASSVSLRQYVAPAA